MRIVLAIESDGTRINDFFEGGSLGRLWKMIGDDGEVDEVSVCRSIIVHTNSSCYNSGRPNKSDDSRAPSIRSFTYPPQIKSMMWEKSAVPFLRTKPL